MPIAKYIKTPHEVKRYTIDYANWLDTGETLSSVSFDIPTPVTDSPLLVDASLINGSGNEVSYFISGGDDGETYEVVLRVTTSGGQTKEDCAQFQVRDC